MFAILQGRVLKFEIGFQEFWTPTSNLQVTLISLVGSIAIALGSEFCVYLPQLIPHMLRVLTHDTSKDRVVTLKLLICLQHLGANLDDYLHLLLPPVVRLFDAKDCPLAVSKQAMETVSYHLFNPDLCSFYFFELA